MPLTMEQKPKQAENQEEVQLAISFKMDLELAKRFHKYLKNSRPRVQKSSAVETAIDEFLTRAGF